MDVAVFGPWAQKPGARRVFPSKPRPEHIEGLGRPLVGLRRSFAIRLLCSLRRCDFADQATAQSRILFFLAEQGRVKEGDHIQGQFVQNRVTDTAVRCTLY